MTELAAGHTGTKTEVTDRDCIVLVLVRKAVVSLCHGSYEDTYAFFRPEVSDIVSYSHDWCVETERYFATIWWQMVGDWVLDYLKQLLLRVGRPD